MPGVTCRWDKTPEWCVTMWNFYVKFHKRGGVPITDLSPDMLDCLEAELHAEAARARRAREKQESQDYLRALGLMK